jgi:protein TonB
MGPTRSELPVKVVPADLPVGPPAVLTWTPSQIVTLEDPAFAPEEVAGGGVVGGVLGSGEIVPSPPPRPTGPVRVGEGVSEPAKLRHVDPVYPDIAMRANVSGNVVLECTVSPQGRVSRVTIIRGNPLLDAAAVEAVRRWVYEPTLRDGVPVPVILTVTVTFALEDGRKRAAAH